MIILKPSDKIPFGKHKGHELSIVYKYHPSYLEWIMINCDNIVIDVEEFRKLPKPTPPIRPGSVFGSKQFDKNCVNPDTFQFLKNDTNNMFNYVTIEYLKKMCEENPDRIFDFKFSIEALISNSKKAKNLPKE